jgi:hypothetical protein
MQRPRHERRDPNLARRGVLCASTSARAYGAAARADIVRTALNSTSFELTCQGKRSRGPGSAARATLHSPPPMEIGRALTPHHSSGPSPSPATGQRPRAITAGRRVFSRTRGAPRASGTVTGHG